MVHISDTREKLFFPIPKIKMQISTKDSVLVDLMYFVINAKLVAAPPNVSFIMRVNYEIAPLACSRYII